MKSKKLGSIIINAFIFIIIGVLVLTRVSFKGLLIYTKLWAKHNKESYSLKQTDSKITTKKITLYNKDLSRTLNVEIADNAEKRRVGLMHRQELGDIDGMLFVFEVEENQAFWMKNTYIPLDIIFFDANNRYVNVAKNAQPCLSEDEVCQNYMSISPAKYVLETKSGFLPDEYFDSDLYFKFE